MRQIIIVSLTFLVLMTFLLSTLTISPVTSEFSEYSDRTTQSPTQDDISWARYLDAKEDKTELYAWINQSRGKYIYIDVFATWCPYCSTEQSYWIQLFNQYGANGTNQVDFYTLSGESDDSLKDIRDWIKTYGAGGPGWFIGKALPPFLNEFNIQGFPTHIMLTPDFERGGGNLANLNYPPVFKYPEPDRELNAFYDKEYNITWIPYADNEPTNYQIYVDGELKVEDTYQNDVPISYKWCCRLKGTYNLTIVLNDAVGMRFQREITVRIVEAPKITSEQQEIEITEGELVNVTWNAESLKPDNYTIYWDGEILINGVEWNSSLISLIRESIKAGTYNATLLVVDQAGHTKINSVTVKVIPKTVDSATVTGFEPLMLTIVILPLWLKRRRRKNL